jgi:fatty acid CoA ligase FadD9
MAPAAIPVNEALLSLALKRIEAQSLRDEELRQAAPLPEVLEALHNERLSAIQVFALACQAYATRPALGERAFTLDTEGPERTVRLLPAFRTVAYGELWRRVTELAAGLAAEPHLALRAGESAGIIGFGSIDYATADLACLYAGVISAVLPMDLGPEELAHLVNEAGYACILCSRESLASLLPILPACPTVRALAVMDLHLEATRDTRQLAEARARAGIPALTLAELAGRGRAGPPLAPFHPAPGEDPLATLMYTSGSTGFPKGAMMPQSLWRSHWGLHALPQFDRFPNIGLSFYPLSHVLGREALLRTLVMGGVMSFTAASNLSTLFEDLRLVRPTFLHLVPRISEMIHQACRTEAQRLQGAGREPAAAQAEAYAAFRSTFLGDRMVAAFIGSAPTAPETAAFLRDCFAMPVYEGFGSTEAGILTLDGQVCRDWVTDYHLVDVPECGYSLGDQPYPRGELLVKTRHSVPGYFHDPVATRNLRDEAGFLRTGDIMEERAPGQLVWVDRKNNVVKLGQGEFVTLWRLESIFSAGSILLDQVYLYANSQRSYLVAVVVPAWDALEERLRLAGVNPEPGMVKQLLRSECKRIAAEAHLRPFEVPRDFLVETEPWTRANGLLTGINKPARPQLKRKYGERLEALFLDLESRSRQGLDGIAQDRTRLRLAETVRRAAAAVLGVPDLQLDDGSFREQGGDSISALALSALLEETCGVPVPVAALLTPGGSLRDLLPLLEAWPKPVARASFAAMHGEGGLIRAEDLRLDRLLDPAFLAQAAKVAAQPLPTQVRTVLLTGANGFLGHILCLEWLEQMAKVGGRVYALVRAGDEQAAAERLGAAYAGCDPDLERRFAALAARHLVVLAGTFAEPGLGLSPARYEELASGCDLIVHAGALVNHVFNYEELFEANVLGTAHLMGLALHRRPKRFDYVSTIGVLAGARDPGKVPEASGVAALKTAWPLSGGYAHGYATSKWASEVLVQELHDRFRLPATVFRPDLILPHRNYRGQVNRSDLLTRLLVSVITTGLAPRSFYAGAPVHYDGLPVDFIAASMVALSSANHPGLATYQVSNPHWEDGVSLDTLMAWVQAAGYPLVRMADYGAWFAAFSERLQALPAAQRRRSSLPILHQWAQPGLGLDSQHVDARRFSQAVRLSKPGGEELIPHLTEAYLHKYLEDLRGLGLLGPLQGAPPLLNATGQPVGRHDLGLERQRQGRLSEEQQ